MALEHKDDWYARFEALRRGELTAQEWEAFLSRPQLRVQGLPPHEPNQREAMVEEYERLHLACRLFLAGYPDFETMAGRQSTFDDPYRLLKTLAVSAINLLDFPCPSVALLEMDKAFGVEVERGGFQVFE